MQVSKKVALTFGVLGLAAGTVGAVAYQSHAAGTGVVQAMFGHRRGASPAAAGAVTAVNGNTITVTDTKSGTSFTVDASKAAIQKFAPSTAPGSATTPPARPTPTTITVGDIVVGDNVSIQGTVSGTNIVATKIMDGAMMGGFMSRGGPHGAFGTVASISGSTITLTGKDGKTYTIDGSSAKINKISSAALSDIKVGDTLMVNGATSGTNVTASSITDGIVNFNK